MDFAEFLEKRLVELEHDRVKAVESLATVREKIAEADAKRAMESGPEYDHKWKSVLKELDRDLEKARSVLVAREAEIEQKRRKLEELRRQAAENTQRGADISMRIMEMSDEELANLTMDDIALLQEYELSLAALEKENTLPPPLSTSCAPAAPTLPPREKPMPSSAPSQTPPQPSLHAEQQTELRPEEPKDASTSRGQLLAMAFRKIARDLDNVTFAEVHAVIDGYASLYDKTDLDPGKERFRDALFVAIQKARQEIERIGLKLDYLAKHPRQPGDHP